MTRLLTLALPQSTFPSDLQENRARVAQTGHFAAHDHCLTQTAHCSAELEASSPAAPLPHKQMVSDNPICRMSFDPLTVPAPPFAPLGTICSEDCCSTFAPRAYHALPSASCIRGSASAACLHMLETAIAADPPALLGLTLLAHLATMVDSSSITPSFLARGQMRKPLLHLCPCAVHLFGSSPGQTTLRCDVVATQPTLPFVVYWQTPYSTAEHQAKI